MLDFTNLHSHIIPLERFQLSWRFNDKKYDILPSFDLKKLKPFDEIASKYLYDFLKDKNLHDEIPFTKDFFKRIKSIEITYQNDNDIRSWLYECGIPLQQEVILSWSPATSMLLPWEILIKYFDSFYYPSSDDLTVFDQSLNWAILFAHYDEIYFGSNL